jgi:ribosomal protein L11 methyltransferase
MEKPISSSPLAPLVLLVAADRPLPALPPNAIALRQLQSTAFGDGSHPTTRLCATAVDFICRQSSPSKVLDVGTGTGVLARIARARGAKNIMATDIDPVALQAAHANTQLDSGPGEIHVSDSAPNHWGDCFDLVIANILEGPLKMLAPQLAGALAHRGILLLSGFTRVQVPSLRLSFEAQGLTYVNESYSGEWALLQLRR